MQVPLQIIQRIRHETDLIATLDPPLQKAAVDSYAAALRAVFVCQAAISLCTLLACMPIEEHPLPWVYPCHIVNRRTNSWGQPLVDPTKSMTNTIEEEAHGILFESRC